MVNNPARTYEFVIILRGARSVEDNWADLGMLNMLNMMLIERCNGMAYRVGVSLVSEAVWAAVI